MTEQAEKQSPESSAEKNSAPVEPEVVKPVSEQELKSLRNVTTVVYALQAASILVGVTYLIAVIVNYIKLNEVRGTWLESHFNWQIRTFWFFLLWTVLGALTLGLGVGYFILVANSIWFIYRIIKGWLNLNDGKEMYI
jgi:uncharacterized membrane protein